MGPSEYSTRLTNLGFALAKKKMGNGVQPWAHASIALRFTFRIPESCGEVHHLRSMLPAFFGGEPLLPTLTWLLMQGLLLKGFLVDAGELK